MLATRSLACRRRCRPACARRQEIAGMTWTEVKLGDAIHVKHGFAFKGQFFADSGTHVVLTPGNFNEGGGFRLRPGKDRFYSGDIPEEYILKEDDLIVAMTEQGPGLLGSSALIPESGRYLHNQRLGLVQIRDDTAFDTRFLYYLFNTRSIREQINGSATGTKVRHTAPERIYRVIASVPSSVEEQRSIGHVLGSYDSLIGNNRRRIHLLQQAARLLYAEWFVHHRFPGHEHVKITDGFPEGWVPRTLGDIAKTNCESYRQKELPENINYIDISSVTQGRIVSTGLMASTGAPGRARRKAYDGNVIWSNVRPNLRAYALILEPDESDVFSTGFTVLTATEVPFAWLYMFVTTDKFVGHLVNHATGAGYPAVRPDDFERAAVVVPPTTLLELFQESAEPSFRLISKLERQNHRLAQARDLLLPRLMSGEIAV